MSKEPVERGIIIPDQHYPLHDRAAIACVHQAIKIVRPTRFVNLGDVGEFENISHWRWKRRRRPPLEYQLPLIEAENTLVNRGLDDMDEQLDKVGCKDKYITQGNHDLWNDHFVEENPYLPHFGFYEAMKWKKRGYVYRDAGKLLQIGKLHFYHGHLLKGIHHARAHLMAFGCNVIYADKHSVQQAAITHADGPKQAWSIGCLKSLRPEDNKFMENRLHNWGHAFAIVDWWDKGHFTVNVVNIIGGRCSLWGHVINGNK